MTPPRSSYLKRRKPLPKSTSFAKRGGKPRPTNPARRKKAFARAYHSKERVAFVKSLGCVYCTAISPFFGIATAGTSHNAHTEGGGMGRKGPYTSIIPLCASHHRCYDEWLAPLDDERLRAAIESAAPEVERRWLSSREGEAA